MTIAPQLSRIDVPDRDSTICSRSHQQLAVRAEAHVGRPTALTDERLGEPDGAGRWCPFRLVITRALDNIDFQSQKVAHRPPGVIANEEENPPLPGGLCHEFVEDDVAPGRIFPDAFDRARTGHIGCHS